MTRAPIEPVLAEIVAEVSRQEIANIFIPTWNILDAIAEKAADLSFDAESNNPEDVAHRRARAVEIGVLAFRLIRDGCGGANA